jgi:hypothetical protein
MARGSQPLVLADLARSAAHKGARAVFIAPDEAAMRAIADVAAIFAPELDVIEFPAWDCLPYDRASPALSVSRGGWRRCTGFRPRPRGRNCWSPPSTPRCNACSRLSASANRCGC